MNAAVIEKVFVQHYRPMCLYALHYVHDLDTSEDLVQECFCKLWEQSGRVHHEELTQAYLYRMLRNACIDFVRKNGARERGEQPSDLEGVLAEEACEEQAQKEARLWEAIDRLPDRCRKIFLMSKRDGMKHKEIAQALGLSVNTVENQVIKALKRLRADAERIYHFFSDNFCFSDSGFSFFLRLIEKKKRI